jgi:hypothetical protein
MRLSHIACVIVLLRSGTWVWPGTIRILQQHSQHSDVGPMPNGLACLGLRIRRLNTFWRFCGYEFQWIIFDTITIYIVVWLHPHSLPTSILVPIFIVRTFITITSSFVQGRDPRSKTKTLRTHDFVIFEYSCYIALPLLISSWHKLHLRNPGAMQCTYSFHGSNLQGRIGGGHFFLLCLP